MQVLDTLEQQGLLERTKKEQKEYVRRRKQLAAKHEAAGTADVIG